LLIKKYGNRRLYDTDRSRYITLEELADLVRREDGVRVVDAKSGEDLTIPTLAQIIVEGRGAARLLPQPLLVQLIRMRDDALAEFLGQYVTWALEMYLQARQGMPAVAPFNPFAAMAYRPAAGFARMFGMGSPPEAAPSPPAPARPVAEGPGESELAELRRELKELKDLVKKRRR
jgi:polyhydroxyalkanoate synthesis repressor PhaR